MTEIGLKIHASYGDGLATAVSDVVLANDFLLRQFRRTRTEEGLVALLVAKGPRAMLLRLKEQLASLPQVDRLEATDAHAQASVPAESERQPAASHGVVFATEVSEDDIDRELAETALTRIAREYPRVVGPLLALERDLPQDRRKATLRHVGKRTGAWAYKRDYALGGRNPLDATISYVVLPALKQLTPVTQVGRMLVTDKAPFGVRDASASAALRMFLCGYLEGMFECMGHLGAIRVVEEMGNDGSSRFAIHDLGQF